MMMIWAAYYIRLEPLTLWSAQWYGCLLEYGWHIFFGGVFDKRDWMLFAARSPDISSGEDDNVHRRNGSSKTVTKNMRVGFFQNKKIKAPPDLSALPDGEAGDKAGNPAAVSADRQESGKKLTAVPAPPAGGSAVSSFLMEIFADDSERCSQMMVKSVSFLTLKHPEIALLTIFSGVTFGELSRLFQASSVQPDDLTRSNARLTLTANASRRADVPMAIGVIIFVVLLKTKAFCEFFVEKTFELRSEVYDENQGVRALL